MNPSDFEQHRPYLVRFAMLQVRDGAAVEDIVQETLLAALTAAHEFAGGSAVRTWLTGILRHKISDHFRRSSRSVSIEALGDEEGAGDLDALFLDSGRYVEPPKPWGDPERALSEQEFFKVLEQCVKGLPSRTAEVFLMRELMELTLDDICNEMTITPTNCSVMLHRGRMRLRACLEEHWFGARAN